jgi:hypothetical protein
MVSEIYRIAENGGRHWVPLLCENPKIFTKEIRFSRNIPKKL